MVRFRLATLALAVVVGVAGAVTFLAFPTPIPAEDAKATDKPAVAKAGEVADNSYCLVCHLNYENEKLTRSHRMAGVGCAKCHGESEKHSGDEDGLTPPEVLFAKSDVDAFCMTCHTKDKVLENDKQKKTEYHKGVFDPKAEDHLVCTECHGENHRMAVRTRKWDKTTRKLLSDDGVRMMYKDSPATEGVRTTEKNPK
jgi:hypothetical protein